MILQGIFMTTVLRVSHGAPLKGEERNYFPFGGRVRVGVGMGLSFPMRFASS
jgi:hypothetical protein